MHEIAVDAVPHFHEGALRLLRDAAFVAMLAWSLLCTSAFCSFTRVVRLVALIPSGAELLVPRLEWS